MNVKFRLLLAVVITLILTILPMPAFMLGIRPPWVLLLLLYAEFYLPKYFNTWLVFLIGISIDVLLYTVIGEHSFALLLTTWLACGKTQRFSFFPIGQQMLLVGVLAFVYQVFLVLIDAFFGNYYNYIAAIGSSLLAVLLWPWVRILAEGIFIPKVRYRNLIQG